jgi:acyl-CoA thioesterase-1
MLLTACGSSQKEGAMDRSRPPASPAPAEPAPGEDGRPVIVALGDSLTAGLGVNLEENYPSKLQKKLDRAGYRYRVVNAGVSGDTTAQGLNRLNLVRELRPEVAIVALGANDGLRGIPPESTRKNLEAIVSELQKDGTKVVLAGMLIPPNYGPEYTRAFRELFPELARTFRLPLIPFLLEGVAGNPNLNQADGIHPTAEGYDIISESVWKVLRPLLRK